MKDKENIVTFTNLVEVMMHFSTQEVCKSYLENIRWNDCITCPICLTDNVYLLKKKFTYKCANKECKQNIFSVTKGTIFENSPVPLQKWFAAIWLMTSHKKGISSLQLHRDLGVTQKSAWFMLHRLRYAVRTRDFNKPLEGVVEADETYIGGENKNRHLDKKIPHNQGRSTMGKVAVFGIVQRQGKVVTQRVLGVGNNFLHPIVHKHVSKSAKLMTDDYRGYRGLGKHYEHTYVNHSSGEYVVGDCHTNTIEGFWSLLKRGWVGIYHTWSAKHTDSYLDEFEYRYNTKEMGESQRFTNMLGIIEGRLTYNQLIS